MHWDDSKLCVKQLWWESAPQSLLPWFSTKKTEQCCYGDERSETKDEGSLDPCSIPYPWSSYLGKIYEDKVVNTPQWVSFIGWLSFALEISWRAWWSEGFWSRAVVRFWLGCLLGASSWRFSEAFPSGKSTWGRVSHWRDYTSHLASECLEHPRRNLKVLLGITLSPLNLLLLQPNFR